MKFLVNSSSIAEIFNKKFSYQEEIKLILVAISSFLLIISLYYTEFIGLITFLVILIFSLFIKKEDYFQEFLVLLILILSTNVFEFGSIEQLPYIQAGPGLRFNFLDILIIISFIKYFPSVIKDKDAKSLNFIIFNVVIATIYVLIGFLLTGSPREAGFNYYRVFFYFGTYVLFYSYLRNIWNLKRLFFILSFWIMAMTIVQVVEFLRDYRFEFPNIIPASSFYSTEGFKILTAGYEKIYAWSRVTILAFMIIPFSLSFYIFYKKNSYLMVLSFSLISFLIALSRIWFLGLAIIILTVIYNSGFKNIGKTISFLLFSFSFLFIIQFLSLEFSNFDLFAALSGRTHSIVTLGTTYGEMDTFSIRIYMFLKSFNKFLESPLLGHGFGQEIWENYFTLDLGAINRLVFMGLIGLVPILMFIVLRIFSLIRKIILNKSITLKAIYIALLAFLLSHLALYLWQIDFYGTNHLIGTMLFYAIYDVINSSHFVNNNSNV